MSIASSAWVTFVVPGEPAGKGRPKFARRGTHVRVYTPAETIAAEERVREAWTDAGAHVIADGGVRLIVDLYVERPAGHYRTSGELSAEGLRHPTPYRTKPDVDNAAKLVMDALNGHAWTDDVRIVDLTTRRHWGEPRTEVTAVRAKET